MNQYCQGIALGIIILIGFSVNSDGQRFSELAFPVEVNNRTLLNPWAGGVGVPQYAATDFNQDGIEDIFSFDRFGSRIVPFVAVDQGGFYKYEYAPEYRNSFPEMVEWVVMQDYNGDGLKDIFACSALQGPFGVEVYTARPDGSFEKVLNPGRDYDILYFERNGGNSSQIYVSAPDLPAIKDIDGDGDVDILAFENQGSVIYYYKNVAVEEGLGLNTLKFVLEDDCWGKLYEDEFSELLTFSNDPNECADPLNGGNSPRHSGSTISLFDPDRDGDQDALIGDLTNEHLVFVENGGSVTSAWATDQDPNFPSYDQKVEMPLFLSAFFIDINKDGIDDMIASVNDPFETEDIKNQWYYIGFEQGGETLYSLEQRDLFSGEMIDLGIGARPAIVDYDADGLLDIVVANSYFFGGVSIRESRLYLFKNVGTLESPSFRLEDDDLLEMSKFSGSNGSNFSYDFPPFFGDLDGDGDDDCLMGSDFGGLFYAENIAGPGQPMEFAAVIAEYMDIDIGAFSVPCIFDVNEDGLNDLVLGTRQGTLDANNDICGSLYYIENVGSPGNPDFNADLFAGNNDPCYGRRFFTKFGSKVFSSPYVVDFNGDKRLYVGTNQGIKVLAGLSANNGDVFDLLSEQFGEIASDERLHPALADLDGDGLLEMLVGHVSGGMSLYQTDHGTDGSVSAEDLSDIQELSVYPNPAFDYLTIDIDGQYHFKISSFDGKSIQIGTTDGLISFDNTYPAGVYFIRLWNESGRSSIGKFVVR